MFCWREAYKYVMETSKTDCGAGGQTRNPDLLRRLHQGLRCRSNHK